MKQKDKTFEGFLYPISCSTESCSIYDNVIAEVEDGTDRNIK